MARIVALALVLATPAAELVAHGGPAEQIVEMLVRPEGDRLTVAVRLPAIVLSDANLPRDAAGYLDLRALDKPLRLVAEDVANNLEIWQDGAALPRPEIATIVSLPSDRSFASAAAALARIRGTPLPPDEQVDAQQGFIDVELRYPASADDRRFSARLNAFRAPGHVVRTVAHYVLPSGERRTLSVAGSPQRIVFDPRPVEVARQFVQRALGTLLGTGDALLFIVCLLIPVREARGLARLFAALACGQALAIAGVGARSALPQEVVFVSGMIAQSALVIAALQNLVGARQGWVWPLALGFGAMNGVELGHTLSLATPFAGAHAAVAAVVFLFVVEAGQLWIAVLVWATRRWLDDRGLPAKPATVLLSAWIAHTAVHRLVGRASTLEQSGALALDRAVVLIVLGWAAVVVVVAGVEALAGSSRRAGATTAAGA